jgi:predicted nucleotidyltransferase
LEITMVLEDLVRSKRSDILRIAARHGATRVRLFGSVARGEAGAESDIDFLVDMERGRSLMDRAALMLDLEQLLERRVDVATERGLKERIRERILREAVPL